MNCLRLVNKLCVLKALFARTFAKTHSACLLCGRPHTFRRWVVSRRYCIPIPILIVYTNFLYVWLHWSSSKMLKHSHNHTPCVNLHSLLNCTYSVVHHEHSLVLTTHEHSLAWVNKHFSHISYHLKFHILSIMCEIHTLILLFLHTQSVGWIYLYGNLWAECESVRVNSLLVGLC